MQTLNLQNGSKIEKVYHKTSVVRARFSPEYGGMVLCEVKKSGRVRNLPLATMEYEVNPRAVRNAYIRQGVAVSSRMKLAG